MRKIFILPVLLGSLLTTVTISAFDGQRSGFVIGGGLGFAPNIKADDGITKQSEPGFGANFVIGFAWDNQNMLVWEGNMAGFEKNNNDVWQGSSTITWYHYFQPTTQTFFVAGGLGLYSYASTTDWGWLWVDEHDQKAGYLIGAGYEFRRHWQMGLYYSFGETESDNIRFDHSNVSLLINVIAF